MAHNQPMTESTDRSRDEVDWTEVSQQLESLLTLAGQQVLADQRVRASYRGAQATSDVTAGTLRGLPTAPCGSVTPARTTQPRPI